MKTQFHNLLLTVTLSIVGGLAVDAASGAFIVPDGSTAPFSDWSRNDTDSLYAEWDVFTSATLPNTPDIGSFGPGASASTVTEAGGNGAFLIGAGTTGNIYSFSAPTEFDVVAPNYGKGTGWNTRVVMQLHTLGSLPDPASVLLHYVDGASVAQSLPFSHSEIVSDSAAGGFGGADRETLFAWDIAGFNPASLQIAFAATSSSMSLASVVVDTFTQGGSFGPMAVPEPSALALGGMACGLIAMLRHRGRQARRQICEAK